MASLATVKGAGVADAARRFRQRYAELDADERRELFVALSSELEVPREQVVPALHELLGTDPEDRLSWSRALGSLRGSVVSPRQTALRTLLETHGGMGLVLQLRAEVLDVLRSGSDAVEPLDRDIVDLLEDWFHHGFLRLEEIDQRSPFRTIRFLKEHEMVHPMVALEDMGRRLGRDRRCFALTHCVMPDEPVVFIEVALSRGLVRSIHEIIDATGDEHTEASRKTPDTAIFYSINSTQNGLAGLGLGTVLIYQVTDALKQSTKGLRTFATLSPIPGFWPRYLRPILAGDTGDFTMTRETVLSQLGEANLEALTRRLEERSGERIEDPAAMLIALLDDPSWPEDETCCRWLDGPLQQIGYLYLTQEKDRRGRPRNPVANFHLGNGATVRPRNVSFLANTSHRGTLESCTLMVSYMYSSTWYQQIGRTVQSLLPWGR
jgi:hypothetical protein